MSEIKLFFEALVAGIVISAIIGPISILFIRKTLDSGVRSAAAIAIGTSIADFFYAIVAALGLAVISKFLVEKSSIIKIFGGIFLIYIACSDAEAKIATTGGGIRTKSNLRLCFEVMVLTFASPVTIGSFLAVFSSLNTGVVTILKSIIMACGVFIGSIIWWAILGAILLKIRHKISNTWLYKIKYTSSIILSLIGLAAIINGIYSIFYL